MVQILKSKFKGDEGFRQGMIAVLKKPAEEIFDASFDINGQVPNEISGKINFTGTANNELSAKMIALVNKELYHGFFTTEDPHSRVERWGDLGGYVGMHCQVSMTREYFQKHVGL